jgi:hypothetical protein
MVHRWQHKQGQEGEGSTSANQESMSNAGQRS